MVLVILDGYGHREERQDNAILNAGTPVMDRLWREQPHTLIAASGLDVGLPDGQMGNSEVGHVNLGAGRIVYQDLTRLDKAIADGDFFANPVLTAAVDKAVAAGKAVHIMGLLSPGGVHSHDEHILAIKRWLHNAAPKPFICMPSSTGATRRRAAPKPRCNAAVTPSPRWASGASPR